MLRRLAAVLLDRDAVQDADRLVLAHRTGALDVARHAVKAAAERSRRGHRTRVLVEVERRSGCRPWWSRSGAGGAASATGRRAAPCSPARRRRRSGRARRPGRSWCRRCPSVEPSGRSGRRTGAGPTFHLRDDPGERGPCDGVMPRIARQAGDPRRLPGGFDQRRFGRTEVRRDRVEEGERRARIEAVVVHERSFVDGGSPIGFAIVPLPHPHRSRAAQHDLS